jgi:hypothetical protein
MKIAPSHGFFLNGLRSVPFSAACQTYTRGQS